MASVASRKTGDLKLLAGINLLKEYCKKPDLAVTAVQLDLETEGFSYKKRDERLVVLNQIALSIIEEQRGT